MRGCEIRPTLSALIIILVAITGELSRSRYDRPSFLCLRARSRGSQLNIQLVKRQVSGETRCLQVERTHEQAALAHRVVSAAMPCGM